jgi:membrane-associated phospholipid phosphatase
VALALFAATYLGIVSTEPGQRIENLALRGAELREPTDRQGALDVLSLVTIAFFGLATTGVFVAGLVLRRPGLGSAAAAVMVVSAAAAQLLKEVVVRPELVSGPGWLLRNSFPSGTATVATSMAIGAYLIAPNRLRWLFLPVGALFAGLVAHAVQASGWHRLSDTIGATALVICIACLGVASIAGAGLAHPSNGGLIDRRVKRVLLAGSIGALAVGIALLALPAVFPLLTSPDGARRAFLQVAFPLIGASITVLLVTIFGLLVEPFSLGRSGGLVTGGEAPAHGPTRGDRASPVRPDPKAAGEELREHGSASLGGSRPST